MTAAVLDRTPAGRVPNPPINLPASIPFFIIHGLAALGIGWLVLVEFNRTALVVCVALCFGRILAITAGYHRYFSHKSYRLNRLPQFLLALWGTTAAQKGPLWWLAHHRKHHRYSDTDRDIHSPNRGFWWSHVGWILCDQYKATDYEEAKDFAKYPELRWLNRHDMWAAWGLAIVVTVFGLHHSFKTGISMLLVGFFLSTVACWHLTFLINSASHRIGKRQFATSDTSRNSWILAFLDLGEGWHNCHHKYPRAARNGFYWWQIDISYYFIRFLWVIGLAKDLVGVPQKILEEGRLPLSEAV